MTLIHISFRCFTVKNVSFREKKWSNTYNILNLEVRLRFHQQITIMHNSTWWTLHLPINHLIYWTLLVVHLEDALVHLKTPNFAVPIIRLNFIQFLKKIDFMYILISLLDMNTSSMFLSPCRLNCPFLQLVFCFVFWRGGGAQPFGKCNPAYLFNPSSIILENRFNVLVCMWVCMHVLLYTNLSIFNVIFVIDQSTCACCISLL